MGSSQAEGSWGSGRGAARNTERTAADHVFLLPLSRAPASQLLTCLQKHVPKKCRYMNGPLPS